MRWRLLINILGLRYRLLWAHVRTRNGKIALFFLAYLLAFSLIPLLASGTVAGAAAAIAVGQASLAARVMLAFVFGNAMLAAVVLGFGSRVVFSDATLRRYPISSAERMLARQLTAFFEPIWLLVLTIDLGLAIAFSLFGGTPIWLGLPAGFLLVFVNFLMARVIVVLLDRMMASRHGQMLFLGLLMVVALVPVALSNRVSRDDLSGHLLPVLDWTPPFAAANLMAGTDVSVLSAVFGLIAWGAILCGALVFVERLPKVSRTVSKAAATWDQPYDWVAGLFGPSLGPLVGKMLRYYIRSPHLRFNYPFAAIMAALFARFSRDANPMETMAIAFFALAGCMSMGGIPINLFGFESSGFRRYLVLPVPPSAVLGAAVLVQLLLAGAVVPFAVGLWWAISPNPVDLRAAVMLLSTGWCMLCLYQALGLWTSLLAARPIGYYTMFGNKLSLAQNVVMIGTMMPCFFLPVITEEFGAETVLAYWWVAPVAMLCAAAFYFASFRGVVAVLPKRREQLMSVLEGRA